MTVVDVTCVVPYVGFWPYSTNGDCGMMGPRDKPEDDTRERVGGRRDVRSDHNRPS